MADDLLTYDPLTPGGTGTAAALAGAPAPTSRPGDDAIKEFSRLSQEDQKLMRQRQEELAPAYKAYGAASEQYVSTGREALARLKTQTKDIEKYTPENIQQSSMQWMAIAAALGSLSGAFSRYHATTALNAFGGALQGWANGNLIKMNENFRVWKASAEAVRDNNEKALREYTEVMQNAKLNLDQKATQVQMIGAKYQDQLAITAAQKKDLFTMAQLIDTREASLRTFVTDTEKLNVMKQHYETMEKIALERLENPSLNTYEGLMKMAEDIWSEPDERRARAKFSLIQMKYPSSNVKFENLRPEQQEQASRVRTFLESFLDGKDRKTAAAEAGLQVPMIAAPSAPAATPAAGAPAAPPGASAPAAAPTSPVAPASGTAAPLRFPKSPTAPELQTEVYGPPPRTATPAGGPRSFAFQPPAVSGRLDGKTEQTAFRLTPGYEKQQAARLPPGTWFINPADGRPIQKGAQAPAAPAVAGQTATDALGAP